ncbi:MAG: hypothetical protein K2Q18_13415 [Bdellovibrionales bacterium]|nr:hypothetical protein [Bdellovibrionales bacterium]
MKALLTLAVLLSSTAAMSSTFGPLKTFTNLNLEKAQTAIANEEVVTHYSAKKILVLKANGKTPLEIRTKTVAQAMHTLCPFFDDGVSVGVNTKDLAGSKTAVDEFAMDMNVTENSESYDVFFRAIKLANSEETVEVYSGAASGNNTAGSVLGFFDVKNNELAVFASTNCGSDN